MDHDRVGDLVMPALLSRVEGYPDPTDVASPGVDDGHQQTHDCPGIADSASRICVDDPQPEQPHAERGAARAPEIDPVTDRDDHEKQVQEDEKASEHGRGGPLRVLVGRAGVSGEYASGDCDHAEEEAERNAKDDAVDEPRPPAGSR